MFPLSMSHQRDKFVGALGRIVSHADQIEKDAAFLQHLGRDHRKYAVLAEHYDAVGASLCATLMHFLGSEWDEYLAGHWTAAYQIVARLMVEAAETSSETSPDWWDAEVLSVERRTMDLTLLTVRPRRPFQYLPGQSISMEIPQRPRQWRYFSPANAPRADGSIDLHVQQIDGGQVSPAVVRFLKVGNAVKLGAPVGERLTRRVGDPRDLLLVAGGTGLAPLLAVLEQIDNEWQRTGRRTCCATAARSADAVAPLRPAEVARTGRTAVVVRLHGGRVRRSVLSGDPRQGRYGRRRGKRWLVVRRWCAADRRWSRTRWSGWPPPACAPSTSSTSTSTTPQRANTPPDRRFQVRRQPPMSHRHDFPRQTPHSIRDREVSAADARSRFGAGLRVPRSAG